MKLIPKTEEEKRKDKITLYRNCINAGLEPMGNDIFTDGEEYFRFGFPKKVSDIKNIIKERYEGNKGSYSVQMHDFESLIPTDIFDILVANEIKEIYEKRAADDFCKLGLSTDIPENVYDPNRDCYRDPYDSNEDLSMFYDYKYL